MLPLLRIAEQAIEPMSALDATTREGEEMGLNEEQMAEKLPSGHQRVIHNRVHWAKHDLTRAGLLESPNRGRFQLTDAGRKLLASKPAVFDTRLLMSIPAFKAWKEGDPANEIVAESTSVPDAIVTDLTPEDRIYRARQEIEANLKADLLHRVSEMDPSDFEQLIIDLLVQMGYGQGRNEMAKALGGSGDGGVDGVVHQDPLGLDRIYIQAKRYKDGNSVGPDAVNSFIGALNVKKANKGLIVTTSGFTKQAKEHVAASSVHVVAVDGATLADLMVRYKVGVRVREMVEILTVDEAFFAE